ncbi:MAG: glycosyltransferase [Actinomycetota bacterium]
MTVAIAAAGTGGHVYPALAIAAALESRGVPRDSILFLGGDRFEAGAVPAAGYRFAGFELTRLHRRLTVDNLRIPFVVNRSADAMAEELRRSEVTVLLAMSGYVTVPAAVAAGRAGVAFVVHEQNSDPTLAVRFGARRAVFTLLGLPGNSERLPRSELVGNPLRPMLADFDRSAIRARARAAYGLPFDGPVVGILGGSQGAQVLNAAAKAIAMAAGAPVLHLTGPAAHGLGDVTDPGLPWTRLAFEPQMHNFYAAVDLVVCRAGAMTVSELAATGTPAVFVPLERVRQAANARVLTSVGGAEMVPQDEIRRLPDVVARLVGDAPGRSAMAKACAATARPDAAQVVASRLLEAAGG